MRHYRCDRCGLIGLVPATASASTLPAGWEPYRASDYAGLVWCSSCVGGLLSELYDQIVIWSARPA